jgi:hypothetical protein
MNAAFYLVGAFVLRFIWRKLRSPSRPFLTVILDTLCEVPSLLKMGLWRSAPDVNHAVSEAIKQTSLTDFGFNDNGAFIQRYDVTRKIGMKKSQACYSPAGHAIIQHTFVKKMKDRLLFVEYIKRHPSLSAIKLRPPIFVIGLTRTGTTFLHEKLGLHEGVRMHHTWEQVEPLPKTDDESMDAQEQDRKRRYASNKSWFEFLFKYMVGEKIQYIHRIGYDEPEECTVPCSFDLPWALTELPMHVYSAKETFPLGAGKAFELYHAFLQLMTWQAPDRRDADFVWMLKCPFHLPYLEELAAAFPGATVVWTHRDPAQCIASACSLFQTIQYMGMEEHSIDLKALGKAMMEYSKLCVQQAEASLARLATSQGLRVVHVRYADNVSKSKEVCRQVFAQADIPFTAEYEARLDDYLQRNEDKRVRMKAKKGATEMHEYRPEEYGLTVEYIRSEFKEYIAKYNL